MDLKKAKQVFDTLVETLDERKWSYEAYPEELTVKTAVVGEDFPIGILFIVDPKRNCVTFRSNPITHFSSDQLSDAALAACTANNELDFGQFSLDTKNGALYYQYSDSYKGCEVSTEFFQSMICYAVDVVDNYNDRFVMLQMGNLSLKQFLELQEDA